MMWFSLLVLIPLAAIVATARPDGWQRLRRHAHEPADLGRDQADRGAVAAASPLLNIVMGTLIAWVLVRDRFWGKRVLDVVIDIPFAMPTIVAGLVLLGALRARRARSASTSPTPAASVYARAGLRDLAVHRPHACSRCWPSSTPDVEEAAASLGRRAG